MVHKLNVDIIKIVYNKILFYDKIGRILPTLIKQNKSFSLGNKNHLIKYNFNILIKMF